MQTDPIAALPFVKRRSDTEEGNLPRDFWSVGRTGDYSDDCRLGADMARAALSYMRQTNTRNILSWAVQDMVDKGEFTGVEIGFLGVIADAAIRGGMQ